MMDAQGHAEAESEIVQGETLVLEMILMQLRLNEGLSMAKFRRRTGHDPVVLFGETLDRLCELGLLTTTDERLALSRAGFLRANYVMAELAAAVELPVAIHP